MYFQKDYVLRMIEMLGETMKRLLRAASESEALSEIDQICQKACGLPLSMLRGADIGSIEGMLSEAQRFLSGELLLIDIEIASRTHMDDELLPRRVQALSFFSTLYDPDYMLAAADRAAPLLSLIQHELPAALLIDAALLCERAEKFSAAEDALFVALEQDVGISMEIERFYSRIERLSEAQLRGGGFSRAEIAEGRDALKR